MTLSRRRHIAKVNLDLAFPMLSPRERKQLLKNHFRAIGIGFIESAMGWWSKESELSKYTKISGLQNLDNALSHGKGVILVSAHFTTLEITGHMLGIKRPLHVLYRKNENPVLESFLKSGRERHAASTIHRDDIKKMIRTLKNSGIVWFAFDQDYKHKNKVFSEFFGVMAATNTATTRLAKITKAAVLPFFARRNQDFTYELEIGEEITDFGKLDEQTGTDILNQKIEAAVKLAPEQYLWAHRRYKTQPNRDNPSPY
jgi:KDO2-lipid IV(A) lauroyltransferase